MSTRYFQNIMCEARSRFPAIHYLTVNAKFENSGALEFDVHLTLLKPEQPEHRIYPETFEMVHIMNSSRSLTATIEEAVRRVNFDNGLEIPMLEIHDDIPPMISHEIEEMISEGSPV